MLIVIRVIVFWLPLLNKSSFHQCQKAFNIRTIHIPMIFRLEFLKYLLFCIRGIQAIINQVHGGIIFLKATIKQFIHKKKFLINANGGLYIRDSFTLLNYLLLLRLSFFNGNRKFFKQYSRAYFINFLF